MGRTAFTISTMVLAVTLGCGGRESRTGASKSGASNASGSGTITGNSSGTSGGSAVAGTGTMTGSGSSTGPSWSSLPLCQVTAFQSTLVWATVCYPAAASPEGTACSGATTACGFCSFFECGVPDQSHSPRQFFSCSCVNGQQQCTLVDEDAGICAPPEAAAPAAPTPDAEVPLYHRATGASCPTTRGPGSAPGNSACAPSCCSSDSECDAGTNGRCNLVAGGFAGSSCSYDECFSDSDCPSGAPCLCRSSPSDNNACAQVGNCVIDSNCGPGGYCSPPSPTCDAVSYHCHTAQDTCINDTDCPGYDAGPGPALAACAYDVQAQHWACTQRVICNLP